MNENGCTLSVSHQDWCADVHNLATIAVHSFWTAASANEQLLDGGLISPEGVCVRREIRQFIVQVLYCSLTDMPQLEKFLRLFLRLCGVSDSFWGRKTSCCWSEPEVIFHRECTPGSSCHHYSLRYCLTAALRCLGIILCCKIFKWWNMDTNI